MLFKRSSSLSAVPDIASLPGNAPLVSARGIEKSYPVGPSQTYVLRRITLDIKPGEFVVQVTHSETNAAYGSRTVNLRDGFMET